MEWRHKGRSEALPLDEESSAKTADDIVHRDAALGATPLNCTNEPDELESQNTSNMNPESQQPLDLR